MDYEPILSMRTDKMILRYAYQKSMKIQLPDKSEWQNWFSPDKKGGLVWYMEGSKTNEGTGAWVHRRGSKDGHSFIVGLHTSVPGRYMLSMHT